MDDAFMVIFGTFALCWGLIGSCFGIKEVYKICRAVQKIGPNEVSERVLGIPYGGDVGSTWMSLYIFPFFFCVILWPLIALDVGKDAD